MSTMLDLESPARQLKTLLDGITDDQLAARTPCGSYTVGDLLDHLMALTVAFRTAATKSTRPSDGATDELSQESRPGEASVAHLHPEWRSLLPSAS